MEQDLCNTQGEFRYSGIHAKILGASSVKYL